MREINDDAVVLRTYKSGEADRVVVLWTRHHGKVRVLAKGVRKTTSRMGGSLETLAHVEVHLVKTRGEFYVARHVQHRERLATLRSSYPRISAGYAVVEAIDAIPSDGVPDEAIFDLLARVLLTLDDETFDPALVPASFYFRLLALDGSEPVVNECVNCGRAGPLVAFDAPIGGTLCDECRQGVSLSADALTLIRRMVGGDLANVLRESNPPGAGEVMAIAQEAIEAHFGRRLRAPGSVAPLIAPSER
ncbi:MAG TPA: DNA repair protein RecO [Acidimicrobiales bacterium]|nr:DNA repair protein RecO [Acidimicrobiales bacterium]